MLVNIHATDDRGNVFTLCEPLTVERPGLPVLTVPAGFESDGCSVPRLFWRLVFPPLDNSALAGGTGHDYIYRCRPAGWSRRDADIYFLGRMILDGVPPWRAMLAYRAVRMFGWLSWRKQHEE